MTPPVPGQLPRLEWVPFLLIGSEGLWAADCLVPGCLWTTTTTTPEAADRQALAHHDTDHERERAA